MWKKFQIGFIPLEIVGKGAVQEVVSKRPLLLAIHLTEKDQGQWGIATIEPQEEII